MPVKSFFGVPWEFSGCVEIRELIEFFRDITHLKPSASSKMVYIHLPGSGLRPMLYGKPTPLLQQWINQQPEWLRDGYIELIRGEDALAVRWNANHLLTGRYLALMSLEQLQTLSRGKV